MRSTDRAPLVIAHRGASGYRPEHTLAAYELAIELGADYIEPDLVSTADGVLIARHENEISGTTDVELHPEFAARRATKSIDGLEVTGFFTEDFTLAELRSLRARERLPQLRPQNTAHDGRYGIATFDEILDLQEHASERLGRAIGVYPETKHPSYFRSIGLPLEEPLVRALAVRNLSSREAPVFVQSFEVHNLALLRTLSEVPLIQLLDLEGAPYDLTVRKDPRTYADLRTPRELARIAEYAAGIGVHKDAIVPRTAERRLAPATSLIEDAHRAGVLVHAWTFRRENAFLPRDFQRPTAHDAEFDRTYGDLEGELALFYELGVDGLFADHPDAAVAARERIRR